MLYKLLTKKKRTHPKTIDIRTETILINNSVFPLKIFYQSRKTAVAKVTPHLAIHLPARLSGPQQSEYIHQLKNWIKLQLESNPALQSGLKKKEYRLGDTLVLLGTPYRLTISQSSQSSPPANHKYLPISLPRKHLPGSLVPTPQIISALKRHFTPKLNDTFNNLNNKHIHKPINKISLRNNQRLWGSCTNQGNISIAVRLLLAPEPVFQYVCIHELAHQVHPNHSKKFWKLVKELDPKYKDHINWLKKHGPACRF